MLANPALSTADESFHHVCALTGTLNTRRDKSMCSSVCRSYDQTPDRCFSASIYLTTTNTHLLDYLSPPLPSVFLLHTYEDRLLRGSLSLTAGDTAEGRDGGVEHTLHRWPYVCMFECMWIDVCVCGGGCTGGRRRGDRLVKLIFSSVLRV